MRASRYLLASALAALLLAPFSALAASVSLDPQPGGVVRVTAHTGDEQVNAFSGEIVVTGQDVSVDAVALGGSVVPMWIERPEPGRLSFAGIVPGGFSGDGLLFAIRVSGPAGAVATLAPASIRMLGNDGEGSPVAATAEEVRVTLSGEPSAAEGADREKPEFSDIVVARDPAVFDGAWFVAFNAQDADAGVGRYEVAELRGRHAAAPADLAWSPAVSPHLLGDQSRRSTVFVRATDRAGNAEIASIAPPASGRDLPSAALAALVVVALALLALAAARRFRR